MYSFAVIYIVIGLLTGVYYRRLDGIGGLDVWVARILLWPLMVVVDVIDLILWQIEKRRYK